MGEVKGSINEIALHDFKIFKELFDYDFSAMEKSLDAECLQVILDYQKCNVGGKVLSCDLGTAQDEKEFKVILTQFYKEFGVGKLGLHKAFRVEHPEHEEVQIVPITNIAHVHLDDLVGYENAKKKLIDNTKAFVEGKKANNCLLFGDAGTGKSSSIKAILNQYYDQGLRMIEVYKHQFQDLNDVIAQIKNRNYKFIIYMDDLSFEESELEYKYLKAIIEGYRILHPKNRIALAAPTGKASRRMAQSTGMLEALTLHSLLGLQGDFCSKDKQDKPLQVDFLIVDEASMVDMWLAHQLFTRLQKDTKLLLLGDVDQLESVGAGNVFAELIGSGIVPVTVLDEIFRQSKDSLIAYNAKFINEENSSLFYGPDFQFVKAENQEEAAAQIQTLYLRELQDTSIGQLQIISPYRTDGEASSNGLNALIRETVNPHTEKIPELMFGERIFRLHDRVMQTKNNYSLEGYDSACRQKFKGVFNGDIGSICKILPDMLCVDYDGRIVEYSKTQLGDLELAYAITIHKSMGSEYETVIIPMLMAHRILLTKNLIYTAVTRAKKRVILVGQKRALFLAIHSGRKVKRNTCLAERILKYNQVFRQKALPQGATEQKLKKAG